MPRFDHVGVVFEDLDAALAFFLSLGFEREGGTVVEGDVVDRINGLEGVRAEIVMVKTPDGSGRLELIRYHAPVSDAGPEPSPANRPGLRHLCIEVENLNGIVERLRGTGHDTVGEVCDYENPSYRLCYLRGPEGLIVELAERLPAPAAA